jgi:RimJ/RimL family protein N-acetyltransferase
VEVVRLEERHRESLLSCLSGRATERLFLLSNLLAGGLTSGESLFQGSWFGALKQGKLCGVLQCVNQGSLLVALDQLDAASSLAKAVAESGFRPLRILGMQPEVEQLFKELQACGDFPLREIRDSLLQVLTQETLRGEGEAVLRQAKPKDIPLLLEWKRRFRIDALGDDPDWVDSEVLRRSLELSIYEGRQFLLMERGNVVSMARLNARTGAFAQLGGVFTPRDQRGHGYATRLVSALCVRCLMEEGLEAVTLMVDAGKQRALAIYDKIGFISRGVYRFLLLEPDGSSTPPVRKEPG